MAHVLSGESIFRVRCMVGDVPQPIMFLSGTDLEDACRTAIARFADIPENAGKPIVVLEGIEISLSSL